MKTLSIISFSVLAYLGPLVGYNKVSIIGGEFQGIEWN